jgi:hypothetical protein
MARCTGYEHCVFGPVDSPGTAVGVPDGSNFKTVTFEHRQTVTIAPSGPSGDILFAIVPSPTGAVAVGQGTVTAQVQTSANIPVGDPSYLGPITFTNTYGIDAASNWASNTRAVQYWLLPFNDKLVTNGSPLDDGSNAGIRADKFRIVTCTARVSYTGATLYDGGVAATSKQNIDIRDMVPVPVGCGYLGGFQNWGPINSYSPVQADIPTNFGAVSAMPGSRTFPARESSDILLVPNDHEWQDIRQAWAPVRLRNRTFLPIERDAYEIFPLVSYDPIVGAIYPCPIEGVGHSDVAFFGATGLVTGAGSYSSITVEVRCCVEYAVGFNSPMARVSKLAAPVDPIALARTEAAARSLPSSRPTTAVSASHGWLDHLGEAVGWYGNTMRSIVGNVWSTAGGVLRGQGGAIGSVGALADGFGRMLLGSGRPSSRHLAIQGGY